MELEPGLVLADRYRLERLLGTGGMAVVWAASVLGTGSTVAIKLVSTSAGSRRELRERFSREARAVASVRHPNVVELLEVFELSDQMPALVMPLLSGETLRARLDRHGTLPLADVADLFLQVASGVGSCHAAGVVHRDLKPENVFLVDDDPSATVKVLDFGVAKLTSDADALARLTASGTSLGTPCYMSPEQAFGERDIDHRSDVWSIGAMIYEALCGGRPVEGNHLGQVLKRFMTEAITPIGVLVPDLPQPAQTLVMRMVARERDARPADLREVTQELARYSTRQTPTFGAPRVTTSAP